MGESPFESRGLRDPAREQIVQITVFEKLLFALGKQLRREVTRVLLLSNLLQQIDEVDQVIQRFDPADDFPVGVCIPSECLPEEPEVGHRQGQRFRNVCILVFQIQTEIAQESLHRQAKFYLKTNQQGHIEQRHGDRTLRR